MYLEYHRGVQTTHSDLKSAFRAAERGLQVWEAVRCATGGGPIDEQPWKRVCFAQFHDAIPGSSIAEVYQEMVPELEGIAEHALQQASEELSQADGEACVFNPLPQPRREVIDGRLVELPPLCGSAVSALPTLEAEAVSADATTLTNGRVHATFNASGEIESLVVDGEPLAFAEPGGQLWTFPDLPANYDAWDIDRYTLSNGTRHHGAADAQVRHEATGAEVAFARSLGDLGSIVVRYALRPGDAVLRIDLDLDLRAPATLVKLTFPTEYRGREARYGGPFGSTKRPQWAGPLTNEAMFENPGSRWACLADDDERRGLMLVSEAKYGFGAYEGHLHVSLARTAMVTPSRVVGDTTSLAASTGEHAYADLQPHTARLALGRFAADAPRREQPAALADLLFTPVLPYTGHPLDAGLTHLDAPPSLVPAWAKPLGDGRWTLRLHETLGGRGPLQLALREPWHRTATDLRDQPLDPPRLDEVSPYQLLSLRIERT
jgi:alpha-mannosidase